MSVEGEVFAPEVAEKARKRFAHVREVLLAAVAAGGLVDEAADATDAVDVALAAFEDVEADRQRWHEAFRRERGRVAGLQSAFTKMKGKRDTAIAEVRELETLLEQPRRQVPDADLVVSKLRHDLAHAVDCLNVDCARCDLIDRRLADGASHYSREHEVAEDLEKAIDLGDAVRSLREAGRQRGVGAQHAWRTALIALFRVVDADVRQDKHEGRADAVLDDATLYASVDT